MKDSVSREVAIFFSEQLMGQYDGHMASIPNNPTLFCLMKSYGISNNSELANFLRRVANKLDKDLPF